MEDTTEPPKTKPPSIHLDWRDWVPYLEDSEASEADKRLLIETVWAIAMGFVDLGWQLDCAEENSGKSLDLTAALRTAVLQSAEANDTDREDL